MPTDVSTGPAEPLPLQRVCLLLVGALLAADAAWNLAVFALRFSDEDQAMFWLATQELVHGRVREPFFYGQAYNTLIEAVPAAALWAAGVPPWVGVPIVALAAGLLPWALFAALAWRRGSPALGLVVLAAPLFLPARYEMLLSLASYNTGVLAAAAGIFAALSTDSPRRRWLSFGALAALGLFLNLNSAVLAGPAALYLLLRDRDRAALRWAWPGAIAVLGLELAGLQFYLRHPSWVVHPYVHYSASLRDLAEGLSHLDRFFGPFVPACLPGAALLALFAPALALAWAIRARRLELIAASASALVGLVLSLALGKVHDGTTSVFYSFGRMYLGLPLLVALLFVLLAGREGRWPARARLGATALLALFSLAAVLHRFSTAEAAAVRAAQKPAEWVQPRAVAFLREECEAIESAARAGGAGLVILGDRVAAYGCAALLYGRLETLFPGYERRTWRLLEENEQPREVVLFALVPDALCSRLKGLVKSCEKVSDDPEMFLARMDPQPAVKLLRRAGIFVRPF